MNAYVHKYIRVVVLSGASSLADSLTWPGGDEREGLCPVPLAIALRAAASVSGLLGRAASARRLRLRLGRRLSNAATVRPAEPPWALQLRLLLCSLLSPALKGGAIPLIPLFEVRVDARREDELSARVRTRRDLRHDRVRRVANASRARPVTARRALLVHCRRVVNCLERSR